MTTEIQQLIAKANRFRYGVRPKRYKKAFKRQSRILGMFLDASILDSLENNETPKINWDIGGVHSQVQEPTQRIGGLTPISFSSILNGYAITPNPYKAIQVLP